MRSVTPERNRGCRRNLVVKRTTLRDIRGNRFQFGGLFTRAHIPHGGFIGLYSGAFSENANCRREQRPYILSTSDELYIVPKVNRDFEAIHPLAMINEPAYGEQSNVCVLEWRQAFKVVDDKIKRSIVVTCMAFHASRPIRKNEELFWWYGNLYDRSHYENPKVGTLLRLRQSDVPQHEWPARYLNSIHERPPTDSYLL